MDPGIFIDTRWCLEKLVSVHVSEDPKLDFVRKNFKYEVMPFGDLLGKVTDARSGKFFYLRSIGENPRKEPARRAQSVSILQTRLDAAERVLGSGRQLL